MSATALRATRAAGLGVCAMLVLVGGCRLEATVAVDIDEEGRGRIVVDLAVDEELAARGAGAGIDLPTELARLAEDLEGWSAGRSQDGRRVRLLGEFADPRSLEEGLQALSSGLDAAELRPLEPFEVTVDGRQVSLSGAAALQPTETVTELGLDVDEAVVLLEETVDYRVAVDLPGELVDHDGDRVDDDGRVVWEVGAGERVELGARSELPADPPLAVLAAAAAGLGLLALLAGWRLAASRGD